ncbi:UbiE/COQ5 family methyltransferase [Natrialba aegyptia DSM 13077]|uniref:UbiE/COQ5 family methyltransferase n=2 Tax=Natrialba aegyptia TaxID=129789 RepID=M0ATG1_9EURY|nr:UbiE/COQ5 family methyltransferase [Natrialba aegyptia DSM 13077]
MNSGTEAIAHHSNDDVREYYAECHSAYKKRWEREGHRSIHYGYFDQEHTDHSEAIPNMKRNIAERVGIEPGDRILDAGCGIGETATWLAKEYNVDVVGINISEMQLGLARNMAEDRNVEDHIEFRFDDFTQMDTIEDQSFDVVWGLESVCYAENKRDFLEQAARALTNGGHLAVADGFLTNPLESLTQQERRNLWRWLNGWKVPNLAYLGKFLDHLSDLNFSEISADDISKNVMPSSKSLYKFSLWGYPLTKLMQIAGMRNQVQTDNVAACYYQGQTLRDHIWAYNIVTAKIDQSAPSS